MEGGTYAFHEPVFIRPEDSGTKESPTIIRSVGDEKVILSGGISINGWKKQGKVWVADVPAFNGRPLDFRQLWVNGKKAVRARDVEDFEKMNRICSVDEKNEILYVPAVSIRRLIDNKGNLKAKYAEMVLHQMWCVANLRIRSVELQVGQPQVIFREIDGVKCEPIEELTINVPEEYSSKIIDMVTRRKGEMVKMENTGERINLEFNMPSRGIIGLRTNVLTASAGEAIMAHRFKEYQPHKGEIERRTNGSMIAMESGTAFAYAIDKLQDRGKFFIFPQDEVYAGQVVGEHSHDNDLVINVTKSKKLTNMRASGSDDKVRLIPPIQFSLEEALEYIKEDEYVEVTPKAMRMRKVILDEIERKRANKN
jgi:hypothetical protein